MPHLAMAWMHLGDMHMSILLVIAKELGRGICWFDFSYLVGEVLLRRWWSLQVKVNLDWTFLEQ